MANELVKVEVPAYMAALIEENPELEKLLKELASGTSSGPAYPQIKIKGSRFRIVDGDIDQILKTTEITVAILRAKENLERAYYVGGYDPDNEKAPDCKSSNGVVPDSDCVYAQNSACAGCQHNVWGTGKGPDGKPSKGKACKERKLIVVAPVDPDGCVTDKAFGMSLPPTSLTPFGEYMGQLKLHGVKIPAVVVTTIGFNDDSNHPMLTFKYSGSLKPAEAAKAVKMLFSKEVTAIIDVPEMTKPEPKVEEKPEEKPDEKVIDVQAEKEPGTPPAEAPPEPPKQGKRGPKPGSTRKTNAFGEVQEPETSPSQGKADSSEDEQRRKTAAALGIPFE